MTFYDLLNKLPIEELWYILRHRHDLSSKPIKAERLFKLYRTARKELLSLHSDNNPTENMLVCEFSIENAEGCAPDSWIHCNMLSPNKENNGEMQQYAMDFVPWNELIDCKVSDESLAKFGELVCAAELLWEITFYGFSISTVADESDKLKEIADGVNSGNAKTYPLDTNDWKLNESDIAEEEKAIIDWITKAPNKVKRMFFGFCAANLCGRDEDVDDITVDETLKRLKAIIDESSVENADDEDYAGLLRAMGSNIDVNYQFLLLSKMFTREV